MLAEMMMMMMGEDLGVEGKESAVREVAKLLLPLPELLNSIASIKADYITRQQASDAQLNTMVAEQVEQAQTGLESLASSQKTITQLRENFVSVEKLCQECQTLIENHDQIKLLSNARNNLNTTLKLKSSFLIWLTSEENVMMKMDLEKLHNECQPFKSSIPSGQCVFET